MFPGVHQLIRECDLNDQMRGLPPQDPAMTPDEAARHLNLLSRSAKSGAGAAGGRPRRPLTPGRRGVKVSLGGRRTTNVRALCAVQALCARPVLAARLHRTVPKNLMISHRPVHAVNATASAKAEVLRDSCVRLASARNVCRRSKFSAAFRSRSCSWPQSSHR